MYSPYLSKRIFQPATCTRNTNVIVRIWGCKFRANQNPVIKVTSKVSSSISNKRERRIAYSGNRRRRSHLRGSGRGGPLFWNPLLHILIIHSGQVTCHFRWGSAQTHATPGTSFTVVFWGIRATTARASAIKPAKKFNWQFRMHSICRELSQGCHMTLPWFTKSTNAPSTCKMRRVLWDKAGFQMNQNYTLMLKFQTVCILVGRGPTKSFSSYWFSSTISE